MEAVQIAFLFIVTFLIARILVRAKLHMIMLQAIFERTKGRPATLVLGVMSLTFLLSCFVPNIITVLALIPVISWIVERTDIEPDQQRAWLTVLGLAVIYSANIGGMATIVGSPANALTLAIVHNLHLPQAHELTFINWLLFGFPMATVMLLLAWGVLVTIRRNDMTSDISEPGIPDVPKDADFRRASGMAALGAFGCLTASVINSYTALSPLVSSIVWGSATLIYIVLVFSITLPKTGQAVLKLSDLYEGLPLRGLLFAGAALLCGLALESLGAISAVIDLLKAHVPSASLTTAILILVFVTIFATELFSNTATALAMWAVAVALADSGAYSPFLPIIGVALASTSAFMSPLATPVTGMAFGGLSGISLRAMLGTGLILNILGATWIVICVLLWVPWIMDI